MSDVVIFGIGDFGRIAREYLSKDSPHTVVAFTAHRRFIQGNENLGLPVIPFEDLVRSHPPRDHAMFIALGFSRVNEARAMIYDECKSLGYELISYVSSQAHHLGELVIGDNCFVFEDNVIQPFVEIGNDVILWSGNHIGHDVKIGDHVFIASHAVLSGNVTIGDHTFVGVNATFRDGVTVAPRCIVGAGALIMKDTVEGGVYAVRGTQPHERKSWELDF